MTATSTSALLGSRGGNVIHVDPSGKDSNSGTVSSPLRSLLAATRQIPDVIRGGHTWEIRLGSGEWDEQLVLDHFIVLGRLIVTGDKANRGNHKVHSFRASSIQGRLELAGFTTTVKDGSGPSFEFQRCVGDMRGDALHAEGWWAKDYGVERVIGYLADYATTLSLRNSTANYKRYAIRSNENSRVFSRDNGGIGCMYGLGARFGGTVQAYGTQPAGDAPNRHYSTDSGGLIIAGQGFKDLSRMDNG